MTRDDWDDPAGPTGQPPPGEPRDHRGASLDPLASLWRRTPPPEPNADRWAETLARIEAALPAPRKQRGPRAWQVVSVTAALLGAVAASLLAALMLRPAKSPEGPLPVPHLSTAEAPLPVLSDGEVTIITITPDESGPPRLVVGKSPLDGPGPLALLGPGEVTVNQIDHEDDGPETHYQDDGASAPMIWTPGRPAR